MNRNNQSAVSSTLVDLAMALLIVLGLIQLEIASDYFTQAAYETALFVISGVAALIASVGIYHGSKTRGWGLGVLVVGGAMVIYGVSHTIGLPGLAVDTTWFEPIGVLSLIVEGAYVVLTLRVLSQNPSLQQDEPRLTAAR